MHLLSKFTKTSPYRQTTFSLLTFQGLRFLYFINSPYCQTTLLLLKVQGLRFLYFLSNFMIVYQKYIIDLVKQVLAGPDMSDFRLLVQFGTFQVQKWYFDEMT